MSMAYQDNELKKECLASQGSGESHNNSTSNICNENEPVSRNKNEEMFEVNGHKEDDSFSNNNNNSNKHNKECVECPNTDEYDSNKRQLMDAITPRPHSNVSENDNQSKPDSTQPVNKKARITYSDNRFFHWKVGKRYQIMRLLGQGSYGEVVQARDEELEKKEEIDNYVAIKRIIRPFGQEVEATRIYREVAILKHLQDHECIIKLQDILISPDDYATFQDLYLIFEYVDTDLHKIILSPQYLSTEHVQIFLYQLLKGVKYLHSANVIHRDLVR